MEIKNCAVLVSGGASGMGAATARAFSLAGAKVAILDMNIAAAEKIATEINGNAIACNVTDSQSVEDAVNQAISLQGIPRVCVNCAGIVQSKRMIGKDGPLPLTEFENIIKVNLVGTFNLMRIAAAAMIRAEPIGASAERGVIINTASVAAFEGQIGQTAYSASKGGVVAMTLPAARELAQFGIRVVTIAPGLVDTPMFEKIPAEARDALAAMVPFPKRLASPAEYAKLALHIVDNAMLNGEVIRLDGALRMQPK
jgi:NAD(P)-dependent dehydrogenase (short-subunit alcohol dehydrogenase family)